MLKSFGAPTHPPLLLLLKISNVAVSDHYGALGSYNFLKQNCTISSVSVHYWSGGEIPLAIRFG